MLDGTTNGQVVAPYATGAPVYQAAGWRGILPLPERTKAPVPSGYTGRTGVDPSGADVAAWTEERPGGNICLRLPDGVVGIDVDAYDGKHGGASLAALVAELGELPPTWTTTARDDGVSGIRLYRVPAGLSWQERNAGAHIELLHFGHRYAVVWPSVNPETGTPYRWLGPDRVPAIGVPRLTDLAELPAAYVERFRRTGVDDAVAAAPAVDPFGVPMPGESALSAGAAGALPGDDFGDPVRAFTRDQAWAFVRPALAALGSAGDGEINNRLNDAAVALSHFLRGGFWTREQCAAWLNQGLALTVYDGRTWRAESTIASGLGARGWTATLLEDGWATAPGAGVLGAEQAPNTAVQLAAAVELSAVDKLRGELLSAAELVARPNPKPLVVGLLDLNSEAWLIGKPGSFKSFVSLDLAGHIGVGLATWQGMRVHAGSVVYIVAEGVGGMTLRLKAWQEEYGPMSGVHFLPRPVQARSPEWATLVELCRDIRPVLTIIDTQARVTVGIEENSATELGMYLEQVRRLREATEGCVLSVHHIGRSGTDARGSSAMDGAQGTELRVERPRERELAGRLVMDKQKDMADDGAVDFRMTTHDFGQDEETGRLLSSLALAPLDPFAAVGAGLGGKVQAWIEDLPKNQSRIVAVLADHVMRDGGTQAHIKALCDERFGPMARTSFSTAMAKLKEPRSAELGPILVGVKGTQRLTLASLLEGDE